MLREILMATAFCGFAVVSFGVGSLRAQNSSGQPSTPSSSPTQAASTAPASTNHRADIPAYHPEAAKGPLPDTLDPQQFSDAETRNAYTLAAKERLIEQYETG